MQRRPGFETASNSVSAARVFWRSTTSALVQRQWCLFLDVLRVHYWHCRRWSWPYYYAEKLMPWFPSLLWVLVLLAVELRKLDLPEQLYIRPQLHSGCCRHCHCGSWCRCWYFAIAGTVAGAGAGAVVLADMITLISSRCLS